MTAEPIRAHVAVLDLCSIAPEPWPELLRFFDEVDGEIALLDLTFLFDGDRCNTADLLRKAQDAADRSVATYCRATPPTARIDAIIPIAATTACMIRSRDYPMQGLIQYLFFASSDRAGTLIPRRPPPFCPVEWRVFPPRRTALTIHPRLTIVTTE